MPGTDTTSAPFSKDRGALRRLPLGARSSWSTTHPWGASRFLVFTSDSVSSRRGTSPAGFAAGALKNDAMVRCAMGDRPGVRGEGRAARAARVVVGWGRLSPAGSNSFFGPAEPDRTLHRRTAQTKNVQESTRDCWKSSSRRKGCKISSAPPRTSSRTCPRDPSHFRFAALPPRRCRVTLATTSPAASPGPRVPREVSSPSVFPIPGIRHVHAAQAVAFVVGARFSRFCFRRRAERTRRA